MTNPAPRLLIMAAGTGGHVYPALSTAEYLLKQGWHIDWLGSGKGIEARLVPDAGYPLHCIDITGLRGKGRWSLLAAPWRLSKALWQAWRLLGKVRPDCVLGMGGFVAGPGGLAAYLRGIPLVIHEQNAIPGLTNRLLKPLSKRVMQAFDGAFNGADVLTVGNPIRAEFCQLADRANSHAGISLLVVGGSLGALALNECVPSALALLPPGLINRVRHQTGAPHLALTQQAYAQAAVANNMDVTIDAYVDDMPSAFADADVVICRSGALTVSELAAAGKAAILVPFPYAVDDHQTANANSLVQAGAAYLLPQKDMNAVTMAAQLEQILAQPEVLFDMAKAAQVVAQPDATQKVAQTCMEIVNG